MPLSVALVGNPNAGKSTLFNALSGLRQRVANYPGVTVEMTTGEADLAGTPATLIDLPGTYSLAARSPDEAVAADLLLGHVAGVPRPDVALAVVDACNLDRHLYLVTQVLELGEPVVVALNMMDLAAARGIAIDAAALAGRLGCPVVPIQAANGVGLDALKRAIVGAAGGAAPTPVVEFPEPFRAAVAELSAALPGVEPFLVARLILDAGGTTEERLTRQHPSLSERLPVVRQALAAVGCPVPAAEPVARFRWVRAALAGAVTDAGTPRVTLGDRVDRVLTHRVWGTLAFLGLMLGIFVAMFYLSAPLMDGINAGKDALSDAVKGVMSPGPLRSLVTGGVIDGVGSVLVFLPQILMLFGFIAVLEDCGYMARAAFLMDRLMAKCGLNGKSFIPLLSSMACAVPGVMGTRVIENRRDRFATILVAPLMSCSARLPVYALLIGAFFAEPWWLPGVMLFLMYMVGLVAAPLVALALKRTVLRGATPVFVMEMPPFRRPLVKSVLRRMFDAGWAFVRRASTLILATMVLVWAATYFPAGDYPERVDALAEQAEAATAGPERDALEAEHHRLYAEWKSQTLLGRVGHWMEPAFRPLGWDWKVGVAALASFPAREVIVGTLGILYSQGDVDPGSVEDPNDPAGNSLKAAIRDDWAARPGIGAYPTASALSLLVFFALCCQCASTLVVIRRETRSWAWPAFTFVYMTALAYGAALVTFQVGRLLG